MKHNGFLSFTKTKELLDPYVRLKLLLLLNLTRKNMTEDKEKILDYYNSLGYRDAQLLSDTQYL